MPKLAAVRIDKKACERATSTITDAILRGFSLRVDPTTGRKTFSVQYTPPGSRSRTRCKVGDYPALTPDEARKQAIGMLSDVAKGRNPNAAAREERQSPTVGDLLDFWSGPHAKAKGLQSQTTHDGLRAIELYTDASLRLRKASTFDATDATHVVGEAFRRAKEGHDARILESVRRHQEAVAAGRTPPRVRLASAQPGVSQGNRVLATLSAAFGTALAAKHKISNPFDAVDKRVQDERVRYLSEEEVARLLDACDAYERRYGGAHDATEAIRLLLFTGARLQEVLSAPWSQFDFERWLWIKPSAHTKQNRLHTFGIGADSPAAEVLTRLRARHGNHAFLFPGQTIVEGEVEIERPRCDLNHHWPKIRALAGLRPDDRLHDLRRTTASFMMDDGAPLSTIGSALGHTQPATTMRYARMKTDTQATALTTSTRRMLAGRSAPG